MKGLNIVSIAAAIALVIASVITSVAQIPPIHAQQVVTAVAMRTMLITGLVRIRYPDGIVRIISAKNSSTDIPIDATINVVSGRLEATIFGYRLSAKRNARFIVHLNDGKIEVEAAPDSGEIILTDPSGNKTVARVNPNFGLSAQHAMPATGSAKGTIAPPLPPPNPLQDANLHVISPSAP